MTGLTRLDVPADTIAVLVAVGAAGAGALLAPGSIARTLLTLPLVLFLPGYALTTVLFPSATGRRGISLQGGRAHGPNSVSTDPGATVDRPDRAGIGSLERLALSFGLSVALTPLVAILVWFAAGTLSLPVLFASLSVTVVVLMVVGAFRRRRVPDRHRYAVPFGRWSGQVEQIARRPRETVTLSQVILTITLVVAVGSLGLAVLSPSGTNSYTDFALLAENESGTVAAANYPDELSLERSQRLVLSVANKEGQETSYSVVVLLQGMGEESPTEQVRVFRQTVPQGETWELSHDISEFANPTSPIVGSRARLSYLLYRGDPPANPSPDNAYRSAFITVEVGTSTGE